MQNPSTDCFFFNFSKQSAVILSKPEISFICFILLQCYEPENIIKISIFFCKINLNAVTMSTNQSPIHWPWKSSIICLLMTTWKLLSESTNSILGIFRPVSSACCRCYLFHFTSLAQQTQWGRGYGGKMSRRSQVISVEVLTHVIEQLCSLSAGE